MKEVEIVAGDVLYVHTNKALGRNYSETKEEPYDILQHTIDQIEEIVLRI